MLTEANGGGALICEESNMLYYDGNFYSKFRYLVDLRNLEWLTVVLTNWASELL